MTKSPFEAASMVPDVENDEDSLEDRWPTAGDEAFATAPPAYGAWLATDGKERRWHMIRGYHRAADLLVAETETTTYLRPKLGGQQTIYALTGSCQLALQRFRTAGSCRSGLLCRQLTRSG